MEMLLVPHMLPAMFHSLQREMGQMGAAWLQGVQWAGGLLLSLTSHSVAVAMLMHQ